MELVGYQTQVALALISLNRPAKLNAVDSVMIADLHRALDLAESDPAVRAIVLYGEGACFSAGFDLAAGSDVPTTDIEFWRSELRKDFDIIMRFWDCPKPTVAAIHGHCLGSGMEMALACDLAVSSEDARFGAPEVMFGSGIVAMLLPWLTNVKAAKEMLLVAEKNISAQRMLDLGLLNRVVAAGEQQQLAIELAGRIAANDSLAVKLTKQAINRSYEFQGMRKALLAALEIDVEIETTDTEESRRFNELVGRVGFKAALASRLQ